MRRLIILMGLLLSASSFGIKSQIRFSPDSLNVDTKVSIPNFNFNIGLPGGLYMKGSNTSRQFKIAIPSFDTYGLSSPCIGGNTISFYYEAYKHKQWIYCREAFSLSDERFKTDITGMPSMLGHFISMPGVRAMKSLSSSSKGLASGFDNEYDLLKTIIPGGIDIIEGDTLINNDELIAVLVKSTQELRMELEQQQTEISELQSALKNLRSNLNKTGCILSCSPNPAESQISVNYVLRDTNISGSISLADNSGNIYKRIDLSAGSDNMVLTISDIPKGINYIILSQKNQTIDTFRFIKQ